MTLKQYAARAVHHVSMLTGRSLKRAKAVRRPRILMYHAIGRHDVQADAFAWQLELLKREFEPLRLPALLERFKLGQCTGDEVAITFDDGVRNHFTAAYPALRAAGVPATFFACPGLMETGHWIWNMEARARLRTLSASERERLATGSQWPTADVEGVISWAKTLGLGARGSVEQSIRDHTRQFDPSAEQVDLFSPMSWEQALALDPDLIDIGSHTVNHPILTTLGAAEQAHEIAASRRMLEARLGRSVDLFCYPNGGNDEAVTRLVREHYPWAVTTEEDFLHPGADPCRLPRVPAAGRPALFLQRLGRPSA